MNVQVSDAVLQQAAQQGIDAFLKTVGDAICKSAGNELNAEAFALLTPDQITLWGYLILREELCDGGFVQLIHNGYGSFFFLNPFAKAMRLWGLKDFSKILYEARELFERHQKALTSPCTDEEFMALYEQFPEFDDLDDAFLEREEDITCRIATYVDEHLHDFVEIV